MNEGERPAGFQLRPEFQAAASIEMQAELVSRLTAAQGLNKQLRAECYGRDQEIEHLLGVIHKYEELFGPLPADDPERQEVKP